MPSSPSYIVLTPSQGPLNCYKHKHTVYTVNNGKVSHWLKGLFIFFILEKHFMMLMIKKKGLHTLQCSICSSVQITQDQGVSTAYQQ